ncbi:hypothetical protein IWQ49_005873 [Labrenzia sp. EL_126]|nr:hypothetical protein [Labrenzia sp. EL_126]
MKFPLIIVALLPLAVTGCGALALERVETAKASMRGAPAEHLEACIGKPAKRVTEGQRTIVTYSSAQRRGPNGLTLPTPGAADDPKACVFAFTVEGGVIRKVDSTNHAGWGGGSITKCAAVMKNCSLDRQ